MSNDNRPGYSVRPRSGQFTLQDLGAAANAMQGSLWLAVQELAKHYPAADLSWLDALHASAVKDAKSAIAEGMDMRVEADALQFGADTVDAAFKAYRDRLTEKKSG